MEKYIPCKKKQKEKAEVVNKMLQNQCIREEIKQFKNTLRHMKMIAQLSNIYVQLFVTPCTVVC